MGFKFKKGSKVEVWNKLERPLGSWCYAEIVSGNGRYYYVRYDPCPSDIGASMERVTRKAIRPCPPDKRQKSWVPGNSVEVLDNSSWKLAEVASVVGGNYYLVRLLGSFREFRVHSSGLRLQQSWQNDKWVVVEKDLEKSPGYNHFPTKNDNGYKELSWDLSRGMKRKLPAVETCTEARKLQAVEKDGSCQRPVAVHAPKVREKGHCWRLVKLASIGPRC